MATITPNRQLTLVEQLQRLANQALDVLGVKPNPSLFIKNLNGEVLAYKHFLSPIREVEFINSFKESNLKIGFFEVKRVQMPNDLYSAIATEIEQELFSQGEYIPQELYEQNMIESYIYNTQSEIGSFFSRDKNTIEEVQLAAVQLDVFALLSIENPSEKVQMAAIEKDPGSITLLESPCEAAQVHVAKCDPFSVSLYLSGETARMVAIEKDPTVIVHIENPSPILCKAAIEKEFPDAKIDYSLTPVDTKKLFEKIKGIETTERRMKVFEAFKSDIATEMNTRIEAIQVLEGNAPERIFEDRFVSVSNQFPIEEMQLKDSINDVESGLPITWEPRMLSDNHYAKRTIQKSARDFAIEIKKSLSPEELLRFAPDLKLSSNLPLGKTPTTEETLLLFKNVYIQEEFTSAIFENEEAGKYEMQKPTIRYEFKGEELLSAGVHPYSPNYKQVFENVGLKQDFEIFEKACCKISQWSISYNYAMQTSDIAEMNDLENKLPALNEKVENSRKLVYNKLNDLYFNIETGNKIENKLSQHEVKTLSRIQRTGSLSKTEDVLLNKFNFLAEKEEREQLLIDRELGADNDGQLYSNEAKVSMKAGHLLEENGVLPRGATKRELIEEGWKPKFIEEIETGLKKYGLATEQSNIIDGKRISQDAENITIALSDYRKSAHNLIDGLTTKIPTATMVEVQKLNSMAIALSKPQTAFAIGEKADQYTSIFKELGVERQFFEFREKWERLNQLCELSSDNNTANLTIEEKRLLLKEYVKADDAFERATMKIISGIKDREKSLSQPDVSSMSKASYADSAQSVGLELANNSADKMKEQLRQLGIPTSEQEKYITELLTFGRTNNLVPIQTSILNQEISALARLSIDTNDNGEKTLKLYFIRKDLSDDLERPYMGHYFSEEQKRNLINTQNAGEVIQITNTKGKPQLVLVSVDKLTGELIAQPVEKVLIPDTFRGVRLTDEDKLILEAGQPLIIENVKVGKNTAYNTTVQYSADFKKIVALADSNKITIVGGAKLSLKESEELRKGKTIQVSNLIDDKGEKYSAFVRIGYPKEEILITPTNEHKVQVRHNNHGEKTENNKRLEKKRGQSPVKSGATQVKRTKREIN